MLGFIDITPKEYSFWQNLWCLSLYVIMITYFYSTNVCSLKKWENRSYWHPTAIHLLFLIFVLTFFADHDAWNYYISVKKSTLSDRDHLEPVYRFIIRFFNRNYFMFRFVVWGGALWLFCKGAKSAKINKYHSLYLLVACYINIFSYSRATLAMSMVFTGYIMFAQYLKKNFGKASIGSIIFISAFFFHKSIVLAMVVSIAMTFVPINKRMIWIVVLCIPLVFLAAKSGISYVVETGMGLNEETAKKALKYSGYVREEHNIMGKIQLFFDYARFYAPTIIGTYMIFFKGKEILVSPMAANLFKIALGLQFIGTSFFFVGFDNVIFAYRILYMSMIPVVYSITDFYSNQAISRRQLKIIAWFGIAGVSYALLYSVYKLI